MRRQHRRHRLRAAALLAVLAGLLPTAQAAESFAYRPPEREPKGERSRFVRDTPDSVLQQVWAYLEEQGLAIETIDPERRLVVARYGGDPRPYLDCGKVELLVDGRPADPPRIYSANKPEVRSARTVDGKRYGLLRRLRLDARLVVEVEPSGKGARARSSAVLVASKQVERLRKGGVPDELVRREVISFRSDEVGRFAEGTTCVSNGKLESLPLQPFRNPSS